ncbi:MAG TPA: Hsp70 family protein, partial [Saprospiraceae bacterium]|nr:Hsp70 family protein [Saprospiraceae bacterium]
FILASIPPMPAGIPKIEIVFTLDADGILKVKAKELRSNTEQEIEIKSTYDISEEEMALMLIDSIQNAEADMKTKALLEAINEANANVTATNKFLNQNKDWLSDKNIDTILSLQSKLLESIEARDKDLIYQCLEELNAYSEPLAQEAMDKAILSSLKGKKI